MFEKFKALFSLKNLSILGLMLNMVGTILIWLYGIPNLPVKDNGVLLLARHNSQEEEISHQTEINRHVFRSNLGMGLLYDQIYEIEKQIGLHNTEAFRRGKASAKLGIPVEENPYDGYPSLREWRDGWKTQMREQENQN